MASLPNEHFFPHKNTLSPLSTSPLSRSLSSMRTVKIGKYVIKETIGTGSFGKVKLGVHEITGHKVAVKILNKEKLSTMDTSGKVKREVRILKLLRHPHIIKLYEVIPTPTDIFMVMEHVPGGELFDYIVQHGRLPEETSRRFFQQIISGIHYCHRHKIVHRDLKPENLLLDANENVRIADFGLSNIIKDGEFLSTSCGSPNYAAPEVITGKQYAGPEVDVWSCGIILYALLCGTLPFDDSNFRVLFMKIKSGQFIIPKYLSPDSVNLLKRMLEVDPIKRIKIQQIIQHDWFTQDCPLYLFPPPGVEETEETDHSVVSEVARKFLTTNQAVIDAIRNKEFDPQHELLVAYNLVLDNRILLSQESVPSDFLTSTSPRSASLRMGGFYLSHAFSPFSPSSAPPDSSPAKIITSGGNLNDSPRKIENGLHSPAPVTASKKDEKLLKWHLGIRAKSRPQDILNEVCQSLISLDYEWKIITPFNLKCRPRVDHYGKVRISLQLYEMEGRTFIVDFKCILPPESELGEQTEQESDQCPQPLMLDFLDRCYAIIKSLPQ